MMKKSLMSRAMKWFDKTAHVIGGSPSDVIYMGQHVYNYMENWMKVLRNTIKLTRQK